MDSLYAKYLKEKTSDQILETEHGFATYRYLDDGKTVYIVDLYVLPEFRKTKVASTIADQIVRQAKETNGSNKLIGSVVPFSKGSTDSVKVLLAYGMSLDSSSNNFIIFRKDI
jgi:GNAT superfamily N-acetyltransferase